MSNLISDRVARRGAAVLAAGLLLGVVPGVAASVAHAALPKQKLTVEAYGESSTSGSSKVYDAPATVYLNTLLTPAKQSPKLKLTVQRLVTGTWRVRETQTATWADGKYWEFKAGAAGGVYRAQVSFAGDKETGPGVSNWKNFKFNGKQTDIKTPKVKFSSPTKAKANKKFPVAVTVTRADGRFLQEANLYSDKYNPKKKAWATFSNGTTALKAKNKSGTVATGKTTFIGTAGKYRLRAAYLGDAGNGRASSPWITVTIK